MSAAGDVVTLACKQNKQLTTSLRFTVTWRWPIHVDTCDTRRSFIIIIFLMGLLAISCFSMIRGLACCINPQPGGPGNFLSRFSSSSPWYASIKLQGSRASFGPPRVFYFPGTRHIWWAFSYLPPGEAPDRRLATSHGQWGPQKWTFGDDRLEFPGRTKLGTLLLNKKWM